MLQTEGAITPTAIETKEQNSAAIQTDREQNKEKISHDR
jgi:hypothetical protein